MNFSWSSLFLCNFWIYIDFMSSFSYIRNKISTEILVCLNIICYQIQNITPDAHLAFKRLIDESQIEKLKDQMKYKVEGYNGV